MKWVPHVSRFLRDVGMWACPVPMVARGTQKPHFSQKKRETGTPDVGRLLQLAPDVFEIVEAFFARLPFGSADGAFGEAAAGFGVVAEVDAVG